MNYRSFSKNIRCSNRQDFIVRRHLEQVDWFHPRISEILSTIITGNMICLF